MCHQYKSKTQTEGDAQECCTTGNLTSKFFLNIFEGEKEKEKKKGSLQMFPANLSDSKCCCQTSAPISEHSKGAACVWTVPAGMELKSLGWL